jgi:hypothetical protein
MRLGEDRIDSIALAITDRLAEEELVDLEMDEQDLANVIAQIIRKDLLIEDEIQREAVLWIEQNRKHLESGTSEWHIELDKVRERLAIRRGYVLP